MVINMKNSKQQHYTYKMVKDLLPGDMVLHPIYRKDGYLLLGRYKILTQELIDKIIQQIPLSFSILTTDSKINMDHFISNKEYKSVDYYEKMLTIAKQYQSFTALPVSIDSFTGEELTMEVHVENMDKTESDNEINYFERLLKQVPSFHSFEKNLDSTSAQIRAVQIRKKLIQLISEDKILHSLFFRMKMYKEIFFIHSINSTSMALLIGLCLELSDEELLDLAIASLFADIGFIKVPKENFNEYLANKEVNKHIFLEHLEHFMEMTSESVKLRNASVIYAIMDRHEHYDGSGFPKGKKGTEISLFGRILFICQSYDELVGGYSQESISQRRAIEKLWKEKGVKYDPDILKLFLYRTNFYKIGQTVTSEGGLPKKIIGFEDFINAPHIPIISNEKE